MSTSTAAAVLAKIAGLSTAAKTALGLVVATGVVGAATAIPAMAEDGPAAPVPTVSASAHPSDDPSTEAPEPSESPEASDETPGADATEAPHPSPSDLPSAAAFGQSVAADARDGGVDGQEISQEAHDRNAARAAGREHPGVHPTLPAVVPTSEPGDAPTLPAVVPTDLPTHP